jgi:hypothetical protein
MKETYLRIDQMNEPYYFDLLFEKNSAPLLSQSQLDLYLPPKYRNPTYSSFVNGYRDPDGLVSYQLYGWVEIRDYDDGSYKVYFQGDTPVRFKILLVFEDGTRMISPIITQTEATAYVVYDTFSLGMQEYPAEVPEQGDLPAIPTELRLDSYKMYNALFVILVVWLAELVFLFLFGYRKMNTYVMVGLIRFTLLVIGTLLFTLGYWIPVVWVTLIFILIFSFWVIFEAVMFPRWIGERKMERTMLFVFSSNLLTMIAILIISNLLK